MTDTETNPAFVSQLWRYPMKGFSAVNSVDSLILDPAVGIIGDRRFALVYDSPSEPAPQSWCHKSFTVAGVDQPRCAAVRIDLRADGRLEASYVQRPQGETLRIEPDQFNAQLFADFAGLKQSNFVLKDSKSRFSYHDSPTPVISIGNLATLRAFAHYAGVNEHPLYGLDPARFRINIWLEGLPAFAEYDWLEQGVSLMIGAASLRPLAPIVRCKAITLDPQGAVYQPEIMQQLITFCAEKHQGWSGKAKRRSQAVMGIFAQASSEAKLECNDKVFVLDL